MKGRKQIRLQNYDYKSDGYYFVTVVSKMRQNFMIGKEQIIKGELQDLQAQINGLYLDYFIVMPNHIHIIFILENCNLRLGEIVRRFKAKVSHKLGGNIWQANYYEHVIRNEQALNKIREYIIHNPELELLKFEEFYE